MVKNIPFIGRKQELCTLKKLLKKKSASLCVINGRRRIGKSRLIEEFARDFPFYEFAGLAPDDIPSNTANYSQIQRTEFVRQMKEQGILGVGEKDWGDIFWQLAMHTKEGRHIILLDEISWMAGNDKDFLAKLKNAWDLHFKKNPNLILILCSSISPWIEKNILSSTGFFGRISLELTLEELSLYECNSFLEALGFKRSVYEKFKLLSVTGGIPWYLEQIYGDESADENIKNLCFTKNGLLVKEFQKIFHDLFGNKGELYKKIILLLANGPVEYNTICEHIDYPKSGRLSEHLDNMTKAGFINRDFTWQIKSGKASKLSQYRLKDNYLRFYLKYIEPNLDKIQQNKFQDTSLLTFPGWDTIMGFQFENLVLNNRFLLYQALGIRPEEIKQDNPFFQRKTARVKGCQIDYLIQTKYNTLFACEIKFMREEVPFHIIQEMKEKISKLALPMGYSCLPVLIHINGVSDKVVDEGYFSKIIDFGTFLTQNDA